MEFLRRSDEAEAVSSRRWRNRRQPRPVTTAAERWQAWRVDVAEGTAHTYRVAPSSAACSFENMSGDASRPPVAGRRRYLQRHGALLGSALGKGDWGQGQGRSWSERAVGDAL
jgi:hypothetical protein